MWISRHDLKVVIMVYCVHYVTNICSRAPVRITQVQLVAICYVAYCWAMPFAEIPFSKRVFFLKKKLGFYVKLAQSWPIASPPEQKRSCTLLMSHYTCQNRRIVLDSHREGIWDTAGHTKRTISKTVPKPHQCQVFPGRVDCYLFVRLRNGKSLITCIISDFLSSLKWTKISS
jgi:hypothetical protein